MKPLLAVFEGRLGAELDSSALATELRRRGVHAVALLGTWHDSHGYRDPVPAAREEAYATSLHREEIEVWVYGWPTWDKDAPQGGLRRWCRDMVEHVVRLDASMLMVDLESSSLIGSAVDDNRVETLYGLLEEELAKAGRKGTPIGVTYFHDSKAPGIRVALRRSLVQILQTYKGEPERARVRLEKAKAAAPKLDLWSAAPAFGENSEAALDPYLDAIGMAQPKGVIMWKRVQMSEREWTSAQQVTRGSL